MPGSQKFYKMNWSWPAETDVWLAKRYKGKTILNFPCGMSKVGTVRADIDPSVKPDIICDLQHPPFRNQSFDVVIMDPPYKYYNKFKWLLDIKDLTKSVIIICSPMIKPNFKHFTPKFYLSCKNNSLGIRIFIEYTRKIKNYSILDYVKPKKLYKKRLTKTPTSLDQILPKKRPLHRFSLTKISK